MAILNRVIERLGLTTQALASARAVRAYEAGLNDGGEDEPVSGTVRRQGYRTAMRGERDLGGLDPEQVLNTVWSLYLSNPVASRAMRLKRDYILGRGLEIQADDDDLQTVLDDFWADNQLDARLKKFVLQLHLLGAQCLPVFVRETDGRVRLGYIDPSQIERVITHPDNVMEKWAVVVKANVSTDGWINPSEKRVYRLIRPQDDVVEAGKARAGTHQGMRVTAEQADLEQWETAMLQAFALDAYTGSCFYFSVNELSNQEMGVPDLLQEADWLDQLDACLFALADRENMADYFSFDVTLTGADETKIKQRTAEWRANPPRKGSVNAHNEKEVWNLNRPDLKQAGSIEASQTLLRFALGGLGIPEHWYAYGSETNRATAEAQGTPTFRSMENEQDDTRDLILALLYFVRDQAIIAGTLPEQAADEEITVNMPEMTTKDMTGNAQALAQVSQALLAVDTLGLMTRETKAKVWARFVAECGVEYDPVEELEKVDDEEAEAELEDAAQTNQDWQAALAGPNGNQPGQTPPQLAPFAQANQELPKSWEG
jgi:hypothetical protein